MSSAEAQIAYEKGNTLKPVESQEMFTQQFDLSQPEKAMSSYQKYVLTLTHRKRPLTNNR